MPDESTAKRKAMTAPIVVSHRAGTLLNGLSVTPITFDHLTGEFGLRVYREMLREPAINAGYSIVKGLVLDAQFQIVSPVTDQDDPDFAAAQEILEFVRDCVEGMNTHLYLVLDEMAEALALQSIPADIVLKTEIWRGRPMLMIDDILVKRREDVAYVEDAFGRRAGYLARTDPSEPVVMNYGAVVDPSKIIPVEKILELTFKESILMPAFNPYKYKCSLLPLDYKFARRWADPPIIGTVGEHATIEPNDDGDSEDELQTPEMAMTAILQEIDVSSVAGLSYGATVEVLDPKTNGEHVLARFKWCDQQMALGIVKLHQAVVEAEHSSKASSSTAFTGLLKIVSSHRFRIAMTVRRLFTTLTKLNFGDDKARMAPELQFPTNWAEDFGAVAQAVAQLYSAGYLTVEQCAFLDAKLGILARDPEQERLREIEEQERDRQAAIERVKLMGGRDDEDEAAPMLP